MAQPGAGGLLRVRRPHATSSPSTSRRPETRSTASSAGQAGGSPSAKRTGSSSRTRCIPGPAIHSHSRSRSSTRCRKEGSKCGRPRRMSGRIRAPSAAAPIPTSRSAPARRLGCSCTSRRVRCCSPMSTAFPPARAQSIGTEYDFSQPRPIGATKLDTAFTDLERDAGRPRPRRAPARRSRRRARAVGRRALLVPDAVHGR